MRAGHDSAVTLDDLSRRLEQLEHQAELIKTVLIVKEPASIVAAEAFEGLRKQIIASNGERRAHLHQLVMMAVAVSRASSLDDVRAQVGEWLAQAGVVAIDSMPPNVRPSDLFEALEGTLDDAEAIAVEEPAYFDSQNKTLVRMGRARPAKAEPRGSGPAARKSESEPSHDNESDDETKGSDE
jgi:hypothetical protein